MKTLLIFLFVFSAVQVNARDLQSADPVIVWPSDLREEQIFVQEALGSWWSFFEGEVVEVILMPTETKTEYRLLIRNISGGLFIYEPLRSEQFGFVGSSQMVQKRLFIDTFFYKSTMGWKVLVRTPGRLMTFRLWR